MELVVHADEHAVAANTATLIAEMIASAGERFSIGLAGGTTPADTYRALLDIEINWSKVDAWLSDERWVSPDHPRSNGRMAAETLMDHVPGRLYRPKWSELLEPMDSAANYEATVRSLTSSPPDLVLLGLGEDGHTASLFPGTEALEEPTRWIVANYVPQQNEDRITVTYPLLWSVGLVVILVVGRQKAQAVRDSFEGSTPAGRLGEGDARVEWHVDRSAASLLS
jgi:6-phosphogluconolactonase